LARELKKFSTCCCFDFRGHGDSKVKENINDLSQDTLIKDTMKVLEHAMNLYPELTVVMVGHSMGGAICTKTCEKAMEGPLASRI